MTVEIFLALLSVFTIVTSLCTQAVKKFLDSLEITYASNVVVLIVSICIGAFGTSGFYILNDYAWTLYNITFIVLMILTNWVCAMVGYDKVMQAIQQIKNT